MKYSFISATLVALASISIAQQLIEETADGTPFVPAPAAPPAQSSAPPAPPVQEKKVAAPAPAPAPAPAAAGGSGKSGPGKYCVNFSGGPFHFLNAGSWGNKAGSGAAAASQCFGEVAGGAMFICESECNGAGDAAPAKYTKLECNFAGGYPNCDISLVDGYSLPLECTIPGASPLKIGGLTDLASLGACPTKAGDNSCSNAQGYAPGNALNPPVSKFFSNANTNDPKKPGPAGNYCVWQTCSGPSDTFWNASTNPTISCQVGTRSAAKKRSDGEVETRTVSEAEVRAVDTSLASHVRRHIGGAHSHARAHIRDLQDVIS